MCAVIIAENLGVFEEFIAGDAALELVALDEMIGFAGHFAAARLPGGEGYGECQTFDFVQQARHEGRFSGAGGRGNDEDCGHSMFRDCSRIRSISALAARPRSVSVSPVSPRPPVFESTVFVSRFISCRRKSSFLPVSPSADSSAST